MLLFLWPKIQSIFLDIDKDKEKVLFFRNKLKGKINRKMSLRRQQSLNNQVKEEEADIMQEEEDTAT